VDGKVATATLSDSKAKTMIFLNYSGMINEDHPRNETLRQSGNPGLPTLDP
jgi:hypothetical protein